MKAKAKPLIKNMTLSALFLALCLVLPMLTGHIQKIGNMLLPMHLPVFLCGLICGPAYGAVIGAVAPLLRSALFSMPPMYPTAIAMAAELLTYGLVSGLLYSISRWQCVVALYRSLITAMLAGRIVWGGMQILLLGVKGSRFTWSAFISGAFTTAIPGIVLQLILIPAIMVALDRAGLVRFKKRERRGAARSL